MDLYDKLKKYFNETPKEQVLKDWKETKIYDNVNSPTIEQFLLHSVIVPKGALVCENCTRFEVCNKQHRTVETCGYYKE